MDDGGSPGGEALPQQTIEAVAKSFFREAANYGFRRQDFLRFVNILLDLGLDKSGVYTPPAHTKPRPESEPTERAAGIAVRPYAREDFELLAQWVEDPLGRQFLSTRPDIVRHRELEALVNDPLSVFGIVSHDEKPIGALAFLNVDEEARKAELRKLIGDPAARGHGYAKIATQYWIEYGVSTLGLRKIYVNTLDTNIANIRLNEELGLRVEGLLREEIFIDGAFHDILRMSLILPG